MTAVELRLTLLQEVATILDDEEQAEEALVCLRHINKEAKVEKGDQTLTNEEMLIRIKEMLQEIKQIREEEIKSQTTNVQFLNAEALLKELYNKYDKH